MTKLTLNNLANLQNENTAVTTINNNSASTVTALENTLSRDGTSPNEMEFNLDMNGWHILNLPEPSSDTDPIRLIDLTNVSEVTNVLHTASSTTHTIGTGNKTFTVPSSLGFFPGQFLLIQDAASSTNYMIGRVVSYSGTSLVFNSVVTAGSGTYSNWVIDISGSPGPVTVEYDTVANAALSTIDPTVSFLKLAGYTTVGDGGDGLYKRQVSMPSHAGKFQSVDGAWWELVSRDVTPEMFGCKGDGLTDDFVNFQNAIDFVTARGGGVLALTPDKEYRIVLDTSFDAVELKTGCILQLNKSQISLECIGYVYGLRPWSYTRIIGPGNIFTTVSSGFTNPFGGDQAIWHAPIALGAAYGDAGTVAVKNPRIEDHDIVIDGVTFSSVRNNGQGSVIQGFGGMYNVVLQNNVILPQTTVAMGIGFDWNGYGTIVSSNSALTRANYDAGTAYTVHPHNIVIRNNRIGAMTMPYYSVPSIFGSHGIRISGGYNIDIVSNAIDYTTYAGIFITGGDLSFEFAPSAVRHMAMKNYNIENNYLYDCSFDSMGIYMEAFPDNVYVAVNNPADPSYPYPAIFYTDGYYTNNVIKGNTLNCEAGASFASGIHTGFIKGLEICGNIIEGFTRGIYIRNGSKSIDIHDNNISLCWNAGIYVNDSTVIPSKIQVRNNWCWRNCTSASTEGQIYVNFANDTIVDGNRLGIDSEDHSLYGLVVDVGSTFTTVTNNTVDEVKTGGTAFRFLGTTSNTNIWVFRDNRYLGVNTFLTGPSIMPVRRDYSTAVSGGLITHCTASRGTLTSDITPTYGSWILGSTVLNVDSQATGQVALTKCVVSGTPGTWKAMSTLP